jgi:hypothetical protein
MHGPDESGGEASLAAEGKSICFKHLPAAEVFRCAGFLFVDLVSKTRSKTFKR